MFLLTEVLHRLPVQTLIISLLMVLIHYYLGPIPDGWLWQQAGAVPGASWLTTHFVHISPRHLIWNLAGLIILGSIIELNDRRLLLPALVLGVIAVDVYLAGFYQRNAYAGLSGVLNTLLVVALYQLAQRPGYRLAAGLTLLGSGLKILIEWQQESALFSSLSWPPVPEAHLAGLCAGLILCGTHQISRGGHFSQLFTRQLNRSPDRFNCRPA